MRYLLQSPGKESSPREKATGEEDSAVRKAVTDAARMMYKDYLFNINELAKKATPVKKTPTVKEKISLKIPGRVFLMLLLPTIQETNCREFLQPLLAETSAKDDVWGGKVHCRT